MPISAQLQRIYTYQDTKSEWWEGLILSHSATGSYYLTNWHEAIQGKVDGVVQMFQPIPFEAVLPVRDGTGQQDLKLAVCNIGGEMYAALNKAIQKPTEHIRARFTQYIVGSTTPQIDPPFELTLTDVTINEVQMSATATRFNVFSLPFPLIRYRPDVFPGLDRR
jgi:hypothetical protein